MGDTDYLQKTLKKLREQRDDGTLNPEQYRQACMKAVTSSPDLEDEEGVSTGSISTVSIVNAGLLSLNADPSSHLDPHARAGLSRRGGGSTMGASSKAPVHPMHPEADSSSSRSRPTERSIDAATSRTPAMEMLGEASFFPKEADQTPSRRTAQVKRPAARVPEDSHGGSAFLALAADRAEKGLPSELTGGGSTDEWLKTAHTPAPSQLQTKKVLHVIAFVIIVAILAGVALLHVSMENFHNFDNFQDSKPAEPVV